MFKVGYDLTHGMLRRSSKQAVGKVRLGSGQDPKKVIAARKKIANDAWSSTPGSGSGFGPAGLGLDQRYSPVFDRTEVPSLGQQFLPADTQSQNKLFKEIATFDPIVGSAIEYWKDLAFSDKIILSGIEDDHVLQMYNEALESSRIVPLMPELLHDFLVMGRIVVHMIFDEKLGYWTDSISHDPDFLGIQLSPSPNVDPLIDLQPNTDMKRWALSKDPRVVEQRQQLDAQYVKLMAAGKKIPLPPEHTIFLPRKVFSYDRIGMSYLTRVLIFKIYEAAVFNASVAGARRGAGPLYHITGWEDATDEELQELLDMFFAAEEDPVGAKVVTKSGVTVNMIGQGPANYWKLSDEWAFLTEGKMRALGISENFLTGEANWNSMETIRTVYLEKVQTMRSFFTRKLLLDRIIKPLARIHGFTKITEAQLAHGIRIGGKQKSDSELILPVMEWDRPITPTRDQEYLELLQTLKDFGVPIDTRMLCQAAGYDLDKVLEGFKGELTTRQKIYSFSRALAKMQQQMGVNAEGVYEGSETGGAGVGEEDFGGGGEAFDFGGGGGGGGFEEPAGGEDLGGGEAEPAPEAAPAAEPPAGGPGGAGGSLKARFPGPKQKGNRIVVGNEGNPQDRQFRTAGDDLLKLLQSIPVWDTDDALFGMPRRHFAKILYEVSKSSPTAISRKELADRLYTQLRKAGLNQLQVEGVLYLGMRFGFLPSVKLPPETYDVFAKLVTSKMNGQGLTRDIAQELIAISRLSGEKRTPSRVLSRDYLKLVPTGEKTLPASKILTGHIDPKKDLLPERKSS